MRCRFVLPSVNKIKRLRRKLARRVQGDGRVECRCPAGEERRTGKQSGWLFIVEQTIQNPSDSALRYLPKRNTCTRPQKITCMVRDALPVTAPNGHRSEVSRWEAQPTAVCPWALSRHKGAAATHTLDTCEPPKCHAERQHSAGPLSHAPWKRRPEVGGGAGGADPLTAGRGLC